MHRSLHRQVRAGRSVVNGITASYPMPIPKGRRLTGPIIPLSSTQRSAETVPHPELRRECLPEPIFTPTSGAKDRKGVLVGDVVAGEENGGGVGEVAQQARPWPLFARKHGCLEHALAVAGPQPGDLLKPVLGRPGAGADLGGGLRAWSTTLGRLGFHAGARMAVDNLLSDRGGGCQRGGLLGVRSIPRRRLPSPGAKPRRRGCRPAGSGVRGWPRRAGARSRPEIRAVTVSSAGQPTRDGSGRVRQRPGVVGPGTMGARTPSKSRATSSIPLRPRPPETTQFAQGTGGPPSRERALVMGARGRAGEPSGTSGPMRDVVLQELPAHGPHPAGGLGRVHVHRAQDPWP